MTARQTSAAARPTPAAAASNRERVLAVIRAAGSHGATADDVADALGRNVYHIRPRITELAAAGLIREDGQRLGSCGKLVTVWMADRQGRLF